MLKKLLLVCLMMSSLSLHAMLGEEPLVQLLSYPPAHKWIKSFKRLDLNDPTYTGKSLLFLAAEHDHSEVCEWLIQQGADVTLFSGPLSLLTREPLQAALARAVQSQNKEVVRVLLTTIPLQAHKEIKQNMNQWMAGLAWLRNSAEPKLPEVINKMIVQKFIDLLALDQMPRIETIINSAGTVAGKPPRDWLLQRFEEMSSCGNEVFLQNLLEIAQMLDIANVVTREKLVMQVGVNIKRILFGEPSMITIRQAKNTKK